MLDFEPRFLGAVSTSGILNTSRAQDTVAWSRDNQVALITHGEGVFIADFVQNHENIEAEAHFVGNETKIPCIRSKTNDLETYTGISLPAVLQSKEKSEVFEIVRDPIINPKELSNAEVLLYFTKVGWSDNPLQITSGSRVKLQHILGVLDSHFRLQLFIKNDPRAQRSENGKGLLVEDDWEICVDFTNSYRNMLISQFWTINVEDESAFSSSIFNEYKRRMYELATVNFTWLPPWDGVSSFENKIGSSFITAHASGDICIWKLCLDPSSPEMKPKFFLALEFRKNLVPGEMVSTLTFHKFSSTFAFLAIGTTSGMVWIFKVHHNPVISRSMKPLPDSEDLQPQKYVLEEGILLCEKDNLEVQQIFFDSGHRGSYLYIIKHPNILLPFSVKMVGQNDFSIQEISNASRIVQGTLAGVSLLPRRQDFDDAVLFAISQRGILRWMNIINGETLNESSMDLAILEEQGLTSNSEKGSGKFKKRFQFGGLAVSPNTAMLCFSKTLAEPYDHLVLRTPSILQFHSLFPARNLWPFLYEKCLLNTFQLQQMTDVLASFKVLMTFSDQVLKEVLDWAIPLSKKTINELQVLYWVLRAQPRVSQDQLVLTFNLRREEEEPFLKLKHQSIRTCRRETLVSDRIMQLRCIDLVERIIANPEEYKLAGNTLNLQSLMVMYEYLESKKKLIKERGPLPLKPRVLVDPRPRQPACMLCGKPIKMISVQNTKRWQVNRDFTAEHKLDKEEIDGVLWHEQEHQQKSRSHPLTSCILSLVPASFPYRKCNFCGTVCSTNPSFQQEPICPLCNGFMECVEGTLNEEEVTFLGDDEIMHFINEIKHQAGKPDQKQDKEPKTSRKARIEKMYLDS